jgi:hypothetical protein
MRQIDKSTAEFAAVLAQASNELGLQSYYRDCVRPLLSMPKTQWPTCCGGGCEPCSQTLVAVAERVCELVGVAQNGNGSEEHLK